MPAQNYFSGKFKEGTFAQGQGPIHGIEISREAEEKGVLGTDDGSGHKLSTVGGSGDGLMGRSEEKGFDIHGAGYKGPQNWAPVNKGETPNFNVNK